MAYSVNWYIENEIIYIHYSGTTTIDELREGLLRIMEMINSSPRQLVHVFTDVGDVTQAVAPKDTITIIREIGPHERSGWNIVLREKSLLIKLGVAFGTTVFKSRTRTFNTIEDAEKFLAEMDQHLSWDKVDRSIIEG